MTSTASSPRQAEKASSSPGGLENLPPGQAAETTQPGPKARSQQQKPAKKGLFSGFDLNALTQREAIDFDLLSHLTHMSAISTSGMGRAELMESTAGLAYSTSKYFRQVHLVARRLSYDYSRACEVVADSVKEESVRNLLLHFATSLSSGEPEEQFLLREAELQRETYGKEYERNIETLQKWSDAYVALMVSATLIVVISLVSMMIYPFSPITIIGLAGLMVCITMVGGWLIFTISPIEVKTHSLKQKSTEQERAAKLAKILLPLAAIVGCVVGWLLGLGPALAAAGAIVGPVGAVAMIDDWKIDARDRDIATFVRALGAVMGTASVTVAVSLSRLNRRALGSLEPSVRRLYIRLKNDVSPNLSWLRLAGESGSEVVTRTVRIFWDGIRVGGDPEKVSTLASEFALKISMLRADRKLVANTFAFVVLPLHAVLVTILLFVTEVVRIFGTQLAEAQSQSLEGGVAAEAGVSTTLLFSAPSLDFIPIFVGTVALMVTAANAFAPYAATGGHRLKIFLYVAIMMVITGLAIMLVPTVVQSIFENIAETPTSTESASPTVLPGVATPTPGP